MLLLDSAPALATLGMVFATAAGLIGAGLGLVKLRGDTNQSAVIQAQGANETMVELNKVLKDDLAACRTALLDLQGRYDALDAQYEHAVTHWGPFPDTDHPAKGGNQ